MTSDVYDANDYEQTLSSCGYVRTDELVQGEGKILNSDVSDVWTKSSDGGDKTWLVGKYTVNDSLFIELRHSSEDVTDMQAAMAEICSGASFEYISMTRSRRLRRYAM